MGSGDKIQVNNEFANHMWVPPTGGEEISNEEPEQQGRRISSKARATYRGLEGATILIHLAALPHRYRPLSSPDLTVGLFCNSLFGLQLLSAAYQLW